MGRNRTPIPAPEDRPRLSVHYTGSHWAIHVNEPGKPPRTVAMRHLHHDACSAALAVAATNGWRKRVTLYVPRGLMLFRWATNTEERGGGQIHHDYRSRASGHLLFNELEDEGIHPSVVDVMFTRHTEHVDLVEVLWPEDMEDVE